MTFYFNTDTRFEDYKQLDALNASMLKTVLHRGIDYGRAIYTNDYMPLASSSMKIGTEVHARILENTTSVTVAPADLNPRTKAYKEWRDGVEGDVISAVEGERVNRIIEAVSENEYATDVLQACSLREVTCLATIDDVPCKARLDAWDGDDTIVDLKTTSSFDDFHSSFFKYGYDLQADFYSLVTNNRHVEFVVVETVAPFRVEVFSFEPDGGRVRPFVKPVWDGLHMPLVDATSEIDAGDCPVWVANLRDRNFASIETRRVF